MASDPTERQFRLLTIHCLLWTLASSMAGGFIGAYLLRLGFSLPFAIATFAVLLLGRLLMRFLMLPLVRRLGLRAAMVAGAVVSATQFLPLRRASELPFLLLWVVIVAVGDCVYWPVCHAANAVCGDGPRRGRQLASRQMMTTLVAIAGPVAGGVLMTVLGPSAVFVLATLLSLLSAVPLLWIGRIVAGPVPRLRAALRVTDRVGMAAFAADGWMSAGTFIAWPMILFTTLGSSYDALGLATGGAAIVGAVVGWLGGIAIDRGHRLRLLPVVTLAMTAGILFRAIAAWAPGTAVVSNAFAAAVFGLYYPVFMSVIYDRAKRSGAAYQFHLAAEAGWDVGAILGCLAAAAVAWGGFPSSLAVVPAVLGVFLIHVCVRADRLRRAEPESPVPVSATKEVLPIAA